MSVEEFLTYKEAQDLAKVSRSAIIEWTARGFLSEHKIYETLVVSKDELTRLMKYREQHPRDWRKTWKKVKDSQS